MTSLDDFFASYPESRLLFDALLVAIEDVAPSEFTASKSQIAFRQKKPFAWAWIPGRYLRGKTAPLVLSLAFHSPDPSPRWKEVVEPARGRFMHHLEIYSTRDIDDEVKVWLRKAWEQAG